MDNLRRFVLVFTLMFFVSAAICGFWLALSYDGTATDKNEVLELPLPTHDPGASSGDVSSFTNNILFIIGDDSREKTDLMFLLNIDTQTRELSFLYLPRDMKYSLSADKVAGTFGDIYSYYNFPGAETAGEDTSLVISSFLNIGVPYYVYFSDSEFVSFINMFTAESQGIRFNVPCDINYDSPEYSVSLSKGVHYLDGVNALKLLRFYKTQDDVYDASMLEFYDGTDIKRINIAQDFAKEFVSQVFMDKSNTFAVDNFKDLAEALLSSVDNNLPLNAIAAMASVFTELNGNNINYYVLSGESISNGAYMEYNEYIIDMELDPLIATKTDKTVLDDDFISITN